MVPLRLRSRVARPGDGPPPPPRTRLLVRHARLAGGARINPTNKPRYQIACVGLTIFDSYMSYIQLTPQKLSAGRRRPRRRRVARRPSAASREKDPAAAGVRRFFSLEQRVEKKDIGPRRSRILRCPPA